MTSNICDNCGKEFSRIYDLKRHQNRVTNCVSGSKTNKKVAKYKCGYCKNSFNRKDSLKRHKNTCKAKLKLSIKHGSKTIKNSGDNNNIINNEINNITYNDIQHADNVNINLVVFAKDGIEHLNYNELKKLFGSDENLIQGLIRIVNLNPDKPEHHNIYFPDLKSTHGEVFENETWIKKKIDEILDVLVDAKLEDLNEILNNFTFLNKSTRNKLKETIESFDYSKPKARKKLKSYLKPILNNNKNMILKTRTLTNKL